MVSIIQHNESALEALLERAPRGRGNEDDIERLDSNEWGRSLDAQLSHLIQFMRG